MFRFFRQIRQRLLSDSQVGKYVLYAIGEILLVVIGILIALQVDNWNTQNENREEAQIFLVRLKNEFLDNKAQLVDKMEMRQQALESARELMRYIDSAPRVVSASSMDSLLAYALPVYTFDPSLGVWNQLTSTDKLTLIQNEILQDKLSIWDAMIEDFKEDEDMYNSYNHNHFRTFIYERYNGRNIINMRIKNKVINSILLSSPDIVNNEIGFSNHSVSPEVLLSSMEFESYVAFVISWLSLINTQSEGLLNHIDSVVDIIEEELNPE